MFFILSKVFYFLVNPVSWIIALLFLAVFSRTEKRRKAFLIASLGSLLLFTNPLLINLTLQKWEYPPSRPSELPLVRTGIMLGGVTEVNKGPETQLHLNASSDRLVESIRLLNEQVIQELIISGGSGSLLHPEEKESIKLEEYLQALNLNKYVDIEDQSRNTHENAVEVSKILGSKNIMDRPVLLITSAYHMRRAIRCFEKQGVTIIPYPVDYQSSEFEWSLHWILPSVEALENWRRLIKEWVGFVAYRIMGYA